MIARGGIAHCIASMLNSFHIHKYPYLALLHNPSGSYYTVVSEDELAKFKPPGEQGRHRLVLRCTEKELLAICSTRQLDLLGGGNGHGPN